MAKKGQFSQQMIKLALSMASPAPVREARGAARYAKDPKKMVTPVAIAGKFMSREHRAVLDIVAILINRR